MSGPQVKWELVGDASKSTKAIKDTGLAADKLGQKFDNLKRQGAKGLAIGAGVAAFNTGLGLMDQAASTAIQFIGTSITKASDLNETLAKSDVVFGDSAQSVSNWGGTLAKSFGISKRAGVEAAASFGNVFVGLGKSQKESAKMSESLVQLAGDLASFNNISTDDALEKLRSGLAGEAEPLRSVGVFLSEAAVKAKAMSLGLADANGNLSESAKITARYQLILEQTTTAQGDFARTSDGLANSQRSLDAQLEDTQATLGQKLLPIQLAVTRGQIGFLNLVTLSADAVDLMNGKLDAGKVGWDRYSAALAEATSLTEGVDAASRANIKTAQASVDAMNRAEGAMAAGIAKTEQDFIGALPGFKKTVTAFYKPIWDQFDIAAFKAEQTARALPGQIAQGILDGTDQVSGAVADIFHMLEDPPDPHAKLTGALYSKELAQGLASQNKYIRDKARDVRLTILQQLAADYFYRAGARAGRYFSSGIRSTSGNTNPNVRAAGGPVSANTPYLVGERGMELFVPHGAGTIIPHDKVMRAGVAGTPVTAGASHGKLVNIYIESFIGSDTDIDRFANKVGLRLRTA